VVTGRLLIAGTWTDAADGATLDVLDPATEDVVGTIGRATDADIDAALVSADAGWREWRSTDPWRRTAVLRRAATLIVERADDLAALIVREQGKPFAEARAEITGAAEITDWCADEARRIYGRTVPARNGDTTRILVTHSPVGPVAAFTASNFPALLPARKLGAALAAGCSVIIKPAEETPFTALALAQAFLDAGLPAGVLNVLTGDPAAISERLIASPVIRKISLTGSVPVGRQLLGQAAARIIPSSLELGGHAPCIVCADADLDAAADAVVRGKWRNGGQVCIATSRLLVDASVAQAFQQAVVDRMAALRLGPGDEPATTVGPLVSARTRARAEDLLRDAVNLGATVRAGGHRPAGYPRGYYFEPTLVTDVPPAARIWSEEPFGPVLPMRTFDTLDEAIEIANDVSFGLAGYAFTRDLGTAMRIGGELDVGMIGINNLVIATAEAPAGGVKESGFGREGGAEALAGYLVPTYLNLTF
jgi:succinate-semialdehyde dehydrogenase / glutarate-semialdehyde dehydrogenase